MKLLFLGILLLVAIAWIRRLMAHRFAEKTVGAAWRLYETECGWTEQQKHEEVNGVRLCFRKYVAPEYLTDDMICVVKMEAEGYRTAVAAVGCGKGQRGNLSYLLKKSSSLKPTGARHLIETVVSLDGYFPSSMKSQHTPRIRERLLEVVEYQTSKGRSYSSALDFLNNAPSDVVGAFHVKANKRQSQGSCSQ